MAGGVRGRCLPSAEVGIRRCPQVNATTASPSLSYSPE